MVPIRQMLPFINMEDIAYKHEDLATMNTPFADPVEHASAMGSTHTRRERHGLHGVNGKSIAFRHQNDYSEHHFMGNLITLNCNLPV